MQDYQQRVIDEQIELNEKLVRLTEFTKTDTYRKLTAEDRELLTKQQFVMVDYNNILAERIARFAS